MPAIRILESKRALTVHDLDALETRIKTALPREYRDFLMRNNGGIPEPRVFDFEEGPHGSTSASVRWFLPVTDNEISNFEQSFYVYKQRRQRMPENLFPVAEDSLGNQVCMSFFGNDKGAIYFWDHDIEADEGEIPSYGNCYLIARSLGDFLNKLYLPDDSEEKAKARRALLFGLFPRAVERQCKIVETRIPRSRQIIRNVGLQLFNAKDQDLLFHGDPISQNFLDMVFWLKQTADGAVSIYITADESQTVQDWFCEEDGGFGLRGYAPGFVVDWQNDRVAKGMAILTQTGIELRPAGMASIGEMLGAYQDGLT